MRHASLGFFSFAAFATVAAFSLALPCAAQRSVTLAGQTDVARLVDLASERLGIRVEYDPAVLKGAVTVRGAGDGGIPDSELWETVNAALAGRGFTIISAAKGATPAADGAVVDPAAANSLVKQAFSVVRLSEASNLVMPDGPFVGNRLTWPGLAPGYAAVFLKVEHRQPKAVAELLKVVLSKTGSVVTPVGESDLLFVADLVPRLKLAAEFLSRIDAPQAPTELAEIPLLNATPADVISFVKDMGTRREPGAAIAVGGIAQRPPGDVLPQPGANAVLVLAPKEHLAFWKDLIARLDTRQALETRNYTPRQADAKSLVNLVEQVAGIGVGQKAGSEGPTAKVIADEFTGTLIVTATASQHTKIAELLSRIDSASGNAAQVARSFVVRNRPVKEVVAVLTELLTKKVENVSVLLPGDSPAPRRIEPTIAASRREEPTTQITSDEGTNTVIVVAEPRVLAQVEVLLATLDVRQPQVMIEVAMISLTDGQSRALGVELDKISTLADGAVRLSSIFSSTSGGGGPSGSPGTGLTASYINVGDFSAVLRALEAVNDGRSTSVPSLLVGNNQQATFSSVAQQPTGTVSTDTTSTTTRGFGGFQDAGTRINVKPQIAEGDHLVLTYNVELSSFTGNPSSDGLPGARQQNTVSSVAMIPDGHAVVVGGIELKTDTDDSSKTPLLSEIPLLGFLFRSNTVTRDRTRFFVLIRANVMRDSGFADLKYVSGRTIESNDLGLSDGWPKVEPRVIK